MEFAVIGLNHHTAPAQIREKAAFTDMEKLNIISYLLDKGIDEVVVLSTCNRSEIYIAGNSDKIYIVKNYYNKILDIEDSDKFIYIKMSEEAIYHLYYVAAGLDSIVIGEDQILGQVKEAHLLAMSLGSSKKLLNKIFREAVSTAKNIKSELKISERPLSVSYIGVKFLKEKLNSLEGKKVFIVGLGKMGRLALTYVLEEKVDKVYVAYRNRQKILDLLEEYPEIEAVNYKDRYKILKNVDILITATSSPHLIIRANEMEELNKELYIIDMAIPRDVDIEVGKIEKVHLFNIDDLKAISESNEKMREELSEKAKEMIKSDVEDLKVWFNHLSVEPVIKSLKEKCDIIQQDTLDYLFRKLDLDNRDKKIIEKMLNSALKRLIREPILRRKNIEDNTKRKQYSKVLEELFQIGMGED